MKTCALRNAICIALFATVGGAAGLARAQSSTTEAATKRVQSEDGQKKTSDATELETIEVTGTRIKGGSVPSPVISIGSEQIRQEGFTDLGEVIRSVPQNFSGGQNPGVLMGNVAGGGAANQNVTGGSSLNLRGLGPDATLTLLNGRRMSYGGFVQAVDISAIPTEAVQRIEIIADGASAIYGSDAVAGVGNVILKRDYEGVSLGARYGSATDGGLGTREYDATTGTRWSSGGLIATFKHVSTDAIDAGQRAYTAHLPEPSRIYPESELRSGLVSAYQALGEIAELRIDALRTRRNQSYAYYFGADDSYERLTPKTTTSLFAPGIEFFLPDSWTLNIDGAWGKDRYLNRHDTVSVADGRVEPYLLECWCNQSRSFDLGAEGPLFAIGREEARLAIGVGYRANEYTQTSYLSQRTAIQADERVRSAYAEVNVPLIGSQSAVPGISRLALTAAVRSEDYQSFGRVTTPKFGWIYGPTEDLTFKASWGKSFKAPTLYQRYNAMIGVAIHPSTFGGAGYAADDTLLFLNGGNPDLDPERARTWSTSVAFHPQALPGLEAELSWFDVDYSQRVVQPITQAVGALTNPIYAEYISTAPTPEKLAELAARLGAFYNYMPGPYDPRRVVAILDARYVNATRQHIRGLDLSGSYRFDIGPGQLTIRGAASWLSSWQKTAGNPLAYDLAGTLNNPARINARLGTIWTHDRLSASLFANHTGGVLDTPRNRKGASFTTFDATLRYVFPSSSGGPSGMELALSAQNLLDRAPPLYSPVSALHVAPYDSTNYSAIGRFLSVSLSKHW